MTIKKKKHMFKKQQYISENKTKYQKSKKHFGKQK